MLSSLLVSMHFADLLSLHLTTCFYSCIIRQVCSIAEYLITCKQFISDCDLAYTDGFQIFGAQVIKLGIRMRIMCLTWNTCEYLHYYLCTVQLRHVALLLARMSSSVCVVLSSVISHRWLPNICSTSDLIRCHE